MDQLVYLSNLNLIKYIWIPLKYILYKEYPNLWLQRYKEEDKKAFNNILYIYQNSIL